MEGQAQGEGKGQVPRPFKSGARYWAARRPRHHDTEGAPLWPSQSAVLAAAHTRAFHGDFEPGAASHFGIFNCLPSLTNSIVPRALEAVFPEWVPLHR